MSRLSIFKFEKCYTVIILCRTVGITEELWNILGHNNSIAYEPWPTFDEEKCKEDEYNLPIQVNGKLRATLRIAYDTDESVIKEKAHEAVKNYLDGKSIVKEIYVKNKIYNIVIK